MLLITTVITAIIALGMAEYIHNIQSPFATDISVCPGLLFFTNSTHYCNLICFQIISAVTEGKVILQIENAKLAADDFKLK